MSLPSILPTRCSAARSAGWPAARGQRGEAGDCAPVIMTGGPQRAGPAWTRSSPRRVPAGAGRPRWPAAGLLAAGAASASRDCARVTAPPGHGVPAAAAPPGQQECLVGFCGLWTERGIPFCQAHGVTWKNHGRPEPGEFAGRYRGNPLPAHERIFLDCLPAPLKLEVQYALQRRRDEREGKAPPYIVMIAVRFLASTGASSLLERTEQEWRDAFGKRGNAIALLAWSRHQVADLAEGTGWDAEYPRDAWQMHRLGFEGRNVLDFSRIPQQQLKDLAKRSSQAASCHCASLPGSLHSSRPAALPVPAVSAGPCSRTTSPTFMRAWPAGRCTEPTSAPSACSSPRSASTAGPRTCRPTRCCSPVTSRPASSCCPGHWPGT